MHVAYVVLYVADPEACLEFWTQKMGMIEKSQKAAGAFSIVQVGFPDQEFSIELVPLEMMRQYPHGMDLATPSMAFRVPNLNLAHQEMRDHGVTTTDINDQTGVLAFAFSDNEDRWFAVLSQ